ncbi:MAG TPA: heme o synthase [Candidatus Limnocylindrales bacterium]|nr:heme o synthase [Candidatus Limnocylindrales bacterium]
MRALRILAVAAAVVTYGLVVLGGVVRVSGSGLGCPDWPLCHGHLLPPLNVHAIIEYSHRTTATLASTLLVLTAAAAWLFARRRPDIRWPALIAVLLLVLQVALGAITVLLELPPIIVLAHLATAQALLGAACITAAAAVLPWDGTRSQDRPSFRAARLAAGATYLLIVSGSLVVGTGASSACTGWPLCGGGLSLSFDRLPLVQLLHRGVAAALGIVILGALLTVLRRSGRSAAVRLWVAFTVTALALQVAVGAAVVLLHLPPALRGLHLALATAVWVGTVTLTMIASRLPQTPELAWNGQAGGSKRVARRRREIALDYLSLAKPRIIPLLLVTALGSMMIAAKGWPSTRLVLLTLLGGALAAAGAGAINCWIDRDIDAQMQRTSRRPVPAGRIAPEHALTFGVTLGTLAFVILAFGVNVLAATLAVSALLFYVLVYTLWLKRTTAQNIVIGGAAGAMPPLVGWAAVTHSLDLTALYLFAIIFFWTPPHFWALALWIKGDYARARIPMLPVVATDREARRQILLYTLVLVALTMMLFATRALGVLYLAGALVLGGIFIAIAVLNLVDRRRRFARPLFDYSLAYLALLFGVMVADRIIA